VGNQSLRPEEELAQRKFRLLTQYMSATPPNLSVRPRNAILAQLPDEEYASLAKFLTPVDLPLGMLLSEPNLPIEYVYFLNSGLISTDALTEQGESVEVGVIGRDGFSGLPALLDQPQMSHSVIMQGIGEGLRIRSSIVRDEFLKGGMLQRMVHAFAYLQMVQVSQSVLCNRMHEVGARLARWHEHHVDVGSRMRREHRRDLTTQQQFVETLGLHRFELHAHRTRGRGGRGRRLRQWSRRCDGHGARRQRRRALPIGVAALRVTARGGERHEGAERSEHSRPRGDPARARHHFIFDRST